MYISKAISDLLGLDSCRVFPAEAELGNGHVVQDDVEVASAVGQLLPNQHGDLPGQEDIGRETHLLK